MQFKGGKCPKCGSEEDCYLEKGLSELMFAGCNKCGYKSWNYRAFGWDRVRTSGEKVNE